MPVSMSTTTESSFTLRRHSTYPSTCHPHIRPTLHNAPQCHAPSSERLCITDEASPLALRSTRIRLRTAVRRGASWTAKCHPAPIWSRRWPGLLGSVCSAELSWLLIDQVAFGRRSFRTAPRRSGVVAAAGKARTPAMPSVAVRVHHPVSAHSAPMSGSGRPAVRCPAVQCPVI